MKRLGKDLRDGHRTRVDPEIGFGLEVDEELLVAPEVLHLLDTDVRGNQRAARISEIDGRLAPHLDDLSSAEVDRQVGPTVHDERDHSRQDHEDRENGRGLSLAHEIDVRIGQELHGSSLLARG